LILFHISWLVINVFHVGRIYFETAETIIDICTRFFLDFLASTTNTFFADVTNSFYSSSFYFTIAYFRYLYINKNSVIQYF